MSRLDISLLSIRHSSFERFSIFIQFNKKRKKRNIVSAIRIEERKSDVENYVSIFCRKMEQKRAGLLEFKWGHTASSIRFDPICFAPLSFSPSSPPTLTTRSSQQDRTHWNSISWEYFSTRVFPIVKRNPFPPLLLNNARNSTRSTVFPNLGRSWRGRDKGRGRVCRQIVTGGTRLPPPLGDFTPLSYIS